MPLSPQEIERQHFLMALRGYDKEQVDAFLKEVAAEQQALLDSVDAARKERKASGSPSGPDPFDGLAAQLKSILKHAAEQADQLRAAAADDVARQLEAARRELVKAGTIRAAAEQEAAEARRELENARSVAAQAESQAAATMENARRRLHDLNAEISAGAQRVDDLREAAAEQGSRTAELRQEAQQQAAELRRSAEREAAELREAAEQQAAELREAAERDAAELRRSAEREAAELREAAEREAAELREAAEREAAEALASAEREAAELRDAADWACQHSANVLEAAEEELRAARQLRAEREQELGSTPVAQRSDHAQPGSGAERRSGDRPRATSRWFPFVDD